MNAPSAVNDEIGRKPESFDTLLHSGFPLSLPLRARAGLDLWRSPDMRSTHARSGSTSLRETETDIVVRIVRIVVVHVAGLRVVRIIVERAAAQHTVGTPPNRRFRFWQPALTIYTHVHTVKKPPFLFEKEKEQKKRVKAQIAKANKSSRNGNRYRRTHCTDSRCPRSRPA